MSADWHKISHVYHEALARNLEERPAFLEAACAGDPRLREEIESLLVQTASLDTTTIGGPPLSGVHPLLGTRDASFASLGAETFGNLIAAMQLREFEAGDFLIRQGDAAESLLLLLSGRAVARLRDAPADRLIGEFGPGDVVGEMSLLTSEPRTADVVAQSRVRALELSSEAFHTIAKRYPTCQSC